MARAKGNPVIIPKRPLYYDKWFTEHPTPHVPLTLEYFPEHPLLQKRTEALSNQQGRDRSL